MATTSIIDGWMIVDGILGTDIDLDTSTYISGETSIKFISGGSVNTKLVSDWMPLDDRSSGGGGTKFADNYYEVHTTVQGDTYDATYEVEVLLETANAAKTSINSRTIYSGPLLLGGAGGWSTIGTAFSQPADTERWARLVIYRTNSTAFNLYVDKAYVNPVPALGFSSWVNEAGASGSFTGSWATANISGAANQLYSFTAQSGQATRIYKPGTYHVHGQVKIDSNLSDGDMLGIRLKVTTGVAGASIPSYIYGTSLTIPAAHTTVSGEELLMGVSGLARADGVTVYDAGGGSWTGIIATVELQVIQHAGTSATYDASSLRVTRIPGD